MSDESGGAGILLALINDIHHIGDGVKGLYGEARDHHAFEGRGSLSS